MAIHLFNILNSVANLPIVSISQKGTNKKCNDQTKLRILADFEQKNAEMVPNFKKIFPSSYPP
jgi:hypothetical protein